MTMTVNTEQPHLRHLVLVGGGHAQIAVLRNLAMKPMPGLRVTLISRDIMTPYSGMLPGFLEGVYDADEIVIDLSHLARLAGARFIAASVDHIDPDARTVTVMGRPPMRYDTLSINIGSNTDLTSIEGAAEHAIPVKPISTLMGRLNPVLGDTSGRHISIIGGGAAGVEVAFSLKQRLPNCRISLFQRGNRLTPEYPVGVSRDLKSLLERKGVDIHLGQAVSRIGAKSLCLENGTEIEVDLALMITAGAPPGWLGKTGLDLDDQGFIAVHPTLQTIGHDNVFVSGDVASLTRDPRPKAGVFAVRAGQYLAENIRRQLLKRPLINWTPQSRYLALIGLGDKTAYAVRGGFGLNLGHTGWRLKEYIDRKFMTRFSDLPEMAAPAVNRSLVNADDDDPALAPMRCLGCGSKSGFQTLAEAIDAARVMVAGDYPDLAASTPITEDSSTMAIGNEMVVQSVDAISAIVDDGFSLGRIAALHAISDLHASHSKPASALAVITLPPAMARLQQDDLAQIMAGAMTALASEGAVLNGGHTAEGPAMQVGFAVTGTPLKGINPPAIGDGDILVLTKSLGIGVIMAAHGAGDRLACGDTRQAALSIMAQSNGDAAAVFARHGGFMMTDVTGFGLARHTLSLLERSDEGLSAEFNHSALPLIPGAETLIRAGHASSLDVMNRQAAPVVMDPLLTGQGLTPTIYHDPQTGGGLMAAIPPRLLDAVLADCGNKGVMAVPVGKVIADGLGQIRAVP